MDQRIIDLHHDYVHHHLDRRLFLERAAKIAGSLSGAAALLPLLDCNFARAQTVDEADPRIATEDVTFEGVTGEMMAYLAKPAGAGPHPAIVVVHEAGGLNPHTRDIARRLATEGYVTLAIDFLSPIGGSAQGGGGRRLAQLNPAETVQNGVMGVRYLRSRDDINGKVGAIGFCWGGRVTQQLSITDPSLDAVVVFYGQPPHPALAERLDTPILLNYADVMLDMNNTGEAIAYKEELERLGKPFVFHMYPGAQHGFNNDTNEARYNQAAAELAWGRTVEFFAEHLS